MSYDLALFRLTPVDDRLYRANFRIGPMSQKIRGVQKIAQMVIKMLLTTPGSMRSNPRIGGGLLRLFQRPLSGSEVPGVQEAVSVAVAFTEEEILRTQESAAMPSDERLLRLVVREITFDEDELAWVVAVQILTEAGDDFVIDLSGLIEEANSS
jgi:phage baseplate assembly protein W